MPGKAEGLVLTVDPNVIHKVDTNNPQNLFSMWTVFSRCAESVEQGRRLENLSWRLWNRETFCCETAVAKTLSATAVSCLPQDIPERQQIPEVPQLSGSVDSVADDEAIELNNESDPLDILRPRILRQDSCASSRSRGRERHITSDHLEKMVVTIIKEKEPNLSPLPHMVSPLESEIDTLPSSCSDVEGTPTTFATESAECKSSTLSPASSSSLASSEAHALNVVRGFSPSQIPSSRVIHEVSSPRLDTIPEPESHPAPKPVQSKKQPANFTLGGSSGSSESPESPKPIPPKKSKMFQLGGSSGSAEDRSPSLKSVLHSAKQASLTAHKKQTSFSNQVVTRTISTPSDQSGSGSYVDESAIDDDEDDSDWEDSIEESGKSSIDDKVTFKRVDSKPNLTSQPSLISLMFAGQEERKNGLSNYASYSTPAISQRPRHLPQHNGPNGASPNDSDDAPLEMSRAPRRTPLNPINEIPRSGAQPIMSKPQIHHYQQAALSPRTTRRNMLATELTESLRRQLLWERQQKSSTANAVLKRRHTSLDIQNLKQYPERSYMNKARDETSATSWNQYLREEYGGYHAQGW
ncbi:DUF1752-domain-containing protein [Xylariaceae sp. FL1272]|nr:DUF1752-domain-containing protein [Xylariaceae sp. FL1272]